MVFRIRYYIGCLLMVLIPKAVSATHIVGGEMNYTCLGEDQYEITLTIFRDCFNGDPNAWFDNPASIGVFNRENELLQEILVPLINNDTLNPILSGECFVIPPNVCVHTTTYRTIITLPPVIGGYQLAYQRCCRNQTIVNIVQPLATGATYGVTISEQALLECNSNPKFQEWPPLYICVNQPIFFDQSAVDIDGDSIVYRLCTPLQGANQAIPQPQPPNPPPYAPINWIDPPYNVNNMLNGAPGDEPLQIDPDNGLLTGLPNTIGQFVVGICIEEYRNGLLISTTRRDFQYNVGICGESISSFFAPEVQCDNLSVQFENNSEGADDFLWIFGDLNEPIATSTEREPLFVFPDTGRYTVTLIAAPGETCRDTFSREIQLKANSLFPDFELNADYCTDTLFLKVNDLSVDTLSVPIAWEWLVLPDATTFTGRNPALFSTATGEITVQLTVTAANGCAQSISKTIISNTIQATILEDSLTICKGESVRLGAFLFPAYTFEWSPANTLNNPLLASPLATPEVNTTYILSVSNEAGCFWKDSIQVDVLSIAIELPPDTSICTPAHWLTVQSEQLLEFTWSSTSDFSDILGLGDSVLVYPRGQMTYYLSAENDRGCRLEEKVNITGNAVDLQPNPTPIICQGDSLLISFSNDDLNDTLQLNWIADDYILFEDGLEALTRVGEGGLHYFFLEATNQFGCNHLDSLFINVIDTTATAAVFSATQCSGYAVNFFSDSPNAPFFVWHFGDPTAPSATAIGETAQYTYPSPGEYEVMVTLGVTAACKDTFRQSVIIGEPGIEPAFSWELQHCADTARVLFKDQSVNTQSVITDWVWDIDGVSFYGQDSFSLTFFQSDTLLASLELISSDGCRDTIQEQILIQVIENQIQDTLHLCFGQSIALNPNGRPDYLYQWSPSLDLDNPSAENPVAKPLSTTLYSVTIADGAENCQLEGQVLVEVTNEILYELPEDQTICQDFFQLYVETEENLHITWANNANFSPPLGNKDSLLVRPIGEQTYYIRLEDENNCTVEDDITINSVAIRIQVEAEETICIGDTADINVSSIGDQILTYAWSPISHIIGPSNTSHIQVNPTLSTSFDLTVTNTEGCQLDTTIRINLFNFIPPLAITADRDTVMDGETTQLFATFNENYSYQWATDPSLSSLTIADPVASPVETTTYALSIRDQNGCFNQASITIFVFSPACNTPFIFVPNAFTPNGDNRNDEFKVYGVPIDELQLMIYDRWGERVFETDNPEKGWDGTFDGRQLPSDVYAYYVRIRCFNGEEFTAKGNITLIR